MKIKVCNLGPIRGPAELDLKPLTILIGPNNAGKTWLAYTLGAIFSTYGALSYTAGEKSEQVVKTYPPLIQAVDKILTTGTATIDLCQFADEYSQTYFNSIASHAPEWLPEFLGTQRASFHGLGISTKLEEAKNQIINRILAYPLDFGIGVSKSNMLINVSKKKGQKDAYIYTTSKNPLEEELPRDVIEKILAREVLQAIHHSLYPDVVILPTERTTFITFPFNALLSKLRLHREEQQDLLADVRPLSHTVSRYILSTIAASRIGLQEATRREKEAENVPEIKEYYQLAQVLEQKILGGKIDFSHAEPEPAREIVFQPTGCIPLEISITSSKVKELVPLAFHLRYFAQPGELLIIDEPEMNLHPKAQVQILEFLAMLVNVGLHVLITTHSSYITDHLLSLTKAHEHADKEAISAKFFLQDKRAFISKENVSFYLVDQGKIIDAMDEDSDWNTFGKVSDTISDIYFSL